MPTQNDNKTCKTGERCENCCELIPAGFDQDIYTHELGDIVYYFCGENCYLKWQQKGNGNFSWTK